MDHADYHPEQVFFGGLIVALLLKFRSFLREVFQIFQWNMADPFAKNDCFLSPPTRHSLLIF